MTSDQVVELAYSVVNNAKSCINKINSVISDLYKLIPDFNVVEQNISDNVSADDIINNSSLAISTLKSQINTSIASANTVIGNIKQSCNNYLDYLENDFNSSHDEKSQVSLPRVSAVSSKSFGASSSINTTTISSVTNTIKTNLSSTSGKSINAVDDAISVVTIAASDSSIKDTTAVDVSKSDAFIFNTKNSLDNDTEVQVSNNINDNTSIKKYYVEEDLELKKYLDQHIKEGSLGNINSSNVKDWDKRITNFLSNSGFNKYINNIELNNKKVVIHSLYNGNVSFDNISSLDELIVAIQDYFNFSY